jgi:hypothetical protein
VGDVTSITHFTASSHAPLADARTRPKLAKALHREYIVNCNSGVEMKMPHLAEELLLPRDSNRLTQAQQVGEGEGEVYDSASDL